MPRARSQAPSILKQSLDLSGLASLTFPCPPNMRVVILDGTLKYATNPGSLDHVLLLMGSAGVIDSGATYENQWVLQTDSITAVATQAPGFTHGMQIGSANPADGVPANFSYQRLEIYHTADANYKTLHGMSSQPSSTPAFFLIRALWKSLLVVDTFQIQAMAGTTFAAGSRLRVTGVR